MVLMVDPPASLAGRYASSVKSPAENLGLGSQYLYFPYPLPQAQHVIEYGHATRWLTNVIGQRAVTRGAGIIGAARWSAMVGCKIETPVHQRRIGFVFVRRTEGVAGQLESLFCNSGFLRHQRQLFQHLILQPAEMDI